MIEGAPSRKILYMSSFGIYIAEARMQ